MSDLARSALPGADYAGFVQVREAGLQGMVTLRGALFADPLAPVVAEATGCAIPAARSFTRAEAAERQLAWMGPDELMLFCPHAEAPTMTAALAQALAGHFATVADVSDARAVFTVSGPLWRDALAKLCPVDFATLDEGALRRTRAAQVAAAILVTAPDEARVICFRSVGQYMFDLLSGAARPGSEPALYG